MGWTKEHDQYWALHRAIFETNPFSLTPTLSPRALSAYRDAASRKQALKSITDIIAPYAQGRDPAVDANKLTYVGGAVRTNIWPVATAFVNIVPAYAITCWIFSRIAELGVPTASHRIFSGYRHPAVDVANAGRDSKTGGLVGGDGGHTSFTAIDRGVTGGVTSTQIKTFTMACVASVAALERWLRAHQVIAPHGVMGGVKIPASSTPCIGFGVYRAAGQASRTHLDVFHRSRRKPSISPYRTWLRYPISNALDAFKDENWGPKLQMDELPPPVVDALRFTIRQRGLSAAL